MGWMPGCPQDPGVFHGDLKPIAIVLHRTYGAWGGDYSVGKQGIFHFLLGKAEGNWVQFAPTEVVQYHCNGANFRAVGIEIEGTNEDPLTEWQSARLGDVLRWLSAEHGISLDYLDPSSVPPASVHVNDGGFRGVISHISVQTDDGSEQHTDEISPAAFSAAVGATQGEWDEMASKDEIKAAVAELFDEKDGPWEQQTRKVILEGVTKLFDDKDGTWQQQTRKVVTDAIAASEARILAAIKSK